MRRVRITVPSGLGTRHERNAYRQGWRAAEDRKPATDCPYPATTKLPHDEPRESLRWCWAAGWADSKARYWHGFRWPYEYDRG